MKRLLQFALLLTLLAWCAPAQGAASIVQHVSAESNANSVTISVTVAATGSSNLLVVGCTNQGTRTVTGVADGGTNTYTERAGASVIFSAYSTEVWEDFSSSSGATSITCTFSGANGTFYKAAFVWEVSGLTGGAADDGENTAGAFGANPVGGSVTTTSTAGFIVGLVTDGNAITANPAAGNEFTSGGSNPSPSSTEVMNSKIQGSCSFLK